MALQCLLRQRRYIIVLVFIGFVTLIYNHTVGKDLLTFGGRIKNVTNISYVKREGCRVKYIDPFSKDIMQYMDIDKQTCHSEKRVQVSIASSNISLSGTDLDRVRIRHITDHTAGYRFGELAEIDEKLHEKLSKNRSGAIQNVKSELCIVPAMYNHSAPPDEIELILSKDCESKDAIFTYTLDRFIIHKETTRCFRPKGGAKQPVQDTHVVLSGKCESVFDVIKDGLLQLVNSTSCVHPLGGSPVEGRKLCLYRECSSETRLTYRWFFDPNSNNRNKTNRRHTLASDMSHLQVQLLSQEVIDLYVLSCVPGPTPTIKSLSVSPNIVVIIIEEASAAYFKRQLKDVSGAMSEMGFMEYQKHSAVSDSFVINLLATFYGMGMGMEREEGGAPMPIFQLARDNNYISMISTDDPSRLDKMKETLDVQHSSLPFFRFLKKEYKLEGRDYCVNGQPMHDLTFNYLLSFLNSYPHHAKLAVTLLSELCRSNFTKLGYLGYLREQMKKFLDYVKHLKNTIVFIQSLKGGETPTLRKVPQGVEEIKRPLLATYVSKDMRNIYEFEKTRLDQLSTPFDIHFTLRDLITSEEGETPRYWKSLLKKVNPRSCGQVSIDPSMCPCI